MKYKEGERARERICVWKRQREREREGKHSGAVLSTSNVKGRIHEYSSVLTYTRVYLQCIQTINKQTYLI